MKPTTKSNWLHSIVFPLLLTLLISACGGGGGGSVGGGSNDSDNSNGRNNLSVGPNVVSVRVYSGGNAFNAPPNIPYVSIKLCSPTDASNCTTINNILLDTGSVGLRVFAQPVNAAPLSTLNLTQQTVTGVPGDNPIAQCMPFAMGVTWGPIQYATLRIGDETADNFPIQVIGDPQFPTPPTTCTYNHSITVLNDIDLLQVNGILGVGLFRQDCGENCTGSNPLNVYYNCDINDTTDCSIHSQAIADQVPNPITLFANNNNGIVITLPPIGDNGATSVTGTLTFGIDTQSNNISTNSNRILIDNNPYSYTYGFFSTTLDDGTVYPYSFLDSGSNGLFFSPATPLSTCTNQFYCAGGTRSFSATIRGVSGSTAPATINFDIADANTLFSNQNNFVFDNIGGTSSSDTFDWGLPFFFGRTVFIAIDGGTTDQGTGPFIGF